MKRKLTALLAAALCPLLVACANPKEFSDGETLTKKYTRSSDITQTYNYADGAQDAPTAYNSYTAAVTGFSFKMLGALAETEQSSFVCSPAVCALELGMLANAASGDLRQDILLALGANFSLSDLQWVFLHSILNVLGILCVLCLFRGSSSLLFLFDVYLFFFCHSCNLSCFMEPLSKYCANFRHKAPLFSA